MPALATTHSLNDYLKLPISRYREQLKQGNAKYIGVNYTHRNKPYQYSIQLTKSACHYGGYRYWWLCPQCSKRVAVLYCAGTYVCRHCIGAKYQTQHLQPLDRQFKRIAVLRNRLDWSGGVAHGIQGKPKGMHQRTYDRLLNEYHSTANRVLVMTLDQLPKGLADDIQTNSR